MHALRSRPSPEGTRLLFAGGMVSPTSYDVSSWWIAEERQKRPDEHTQDEGRDNIRKKTRVDRNEVVRFRWIWVKIFCLVLRGDLVFVISQGISRYIMTSCPIPGTYHAISQDTISCHLYIPNFLGLMVWEISYPVDLFSITFFCQLGAPSTVHQESKRNGILATEL